MPIVNIPAKVRFALYLVGAVALLTVSYAVDKKWAGDAEVRYVTGLAALLQLLAAAKTDLSQGVQGRHERGYTDLGGVLGVVLLLALVLVVLRVFGLI